MAPKIEIKNGTEKLTSNSGLAIVEAILDNTELKIRVNEDNPAMGAIPFSGMSKHAESDFGF